MTALHQKSEPPAVAGGLTLESLKIDLNVREANLQPSATADGSDSLCKAGYDALDAVGVE